MKLVAAVVGLVVLSVLPADAWPQETSTRFGPLEVVPVKIDETIHFSGRPVNGPSGQTLQFRFQIIEVWQLTDEDVALIRGWSGGNDPCFDEFLFVRTTTAGAWATAPFGRCAQQLIDARADGGRVEIDLTAADPRLDRLAIAYSDGQVTETKIPLPDMPAQLPVGSATVTRWVGAHAHEIVRDAGERQRFMTVMSREQMFQLMDRVAVSSRAEIRGGWLVVTGNMPHQGCVEMGGLAIEVQTGRVEAVMFHKGSEPEVFGGTLGSLRPALEEVARIGSANCKAG